MCYLFVAVRQKVPQADDSTPRNIRHRPSAHLTDPESCLAEVDEQLLDGQAKDSVAGELGGRLPGRQLTQLSHKLKHVCQMRRGAIYGH